MVKLAIRGKARLKLFSASLTKRKLIGAKIHVGMQKRIPESRVKNYADYLAELFRSKTGTF